MIKSKIKNLDLSATLKINEISKSLEKQGKKIIKFGFANASIFFILFPSIIFLTANSTILPFFVLGISLTSMIFAGTCLGDASNLIVFLSFSMKTLSNELGLFKTKNNTILTSLSQD